MICLFDKDAMTRRGSWVGMKRCDLLLRHLGETTIKPHWVELQVFGCGTMHFG